MASNGPTIIIKRKKAGGHGGHHGGAWKVAYADFVTAMMAFFLLLWLLNVTTKEQKNGIADYFTPSTAALETASGAGDILGGTTITVEGPSVTESSPIATADPVAQRYNSYAEDEADESGSTVEDPNQNAETGGLNTGKTSSETVDSPNNEVGQNTGTQTEKQPTEEDLNKALAEREKKQFEAVAEELRQAIQKVPELLNMQDSLIIDQTPEGLRIQIVDREGYSMFPRGSARMDVKADDLLKLVATAVQKLPNKLSISGHTDSTPYANLNGYSNWELSSDRANATRRTLMDSGIPENRIATVVGRADREPYMKGDPADPRNRRLSIILLRQALTNSDKPALLPEPAIEGGLEGTSEPAP